LRDLAQMAEVSLVSDFALQPSPRRFPDDAEEKVAPSLRRLASRPQRVLIWVQRNLAVERSSTRPRAVIAFQAAAVDRFVKRLISAERARWTAFESEPAPAALEIKGAKE
jgi:hypothetical protein